MHPNITLNISVEYVGGENAFYSVSSDYFPETEFAIKEAQEILIKTLNIPRLSKGKDISKFSITKPFKIMIDGVLPFVRLSITNKPHLGDSAH